MPQILAINLLSLSPPVKLVVKCLVAYNGPCPLAKRCLADTNLNYV